MLVFGDVPPIFVDLNTELTPAKVETTADGTLNAKSKCLLHGPNSWFDGPPGRGLGR